MLKNHKLLVDAYCPMCTLYGKCFTSFGLIDKQTVSPYQKEAAYNKFPIDMERAKSEIALHNLETNETAYGIDAFIEILSQRQKNIKRLFEFKPIYILLNMLYMFISANRKIITRPIEKKKFDACTPPLNLTLRITYVVLATFATGLLLPSFTSSLFNQIGWPVSLHLELIVCFGQVIFQWMIFKLLYTKNEWEYLGHMATISLIGALALYTVSFFLPLGSFSLITLLMLFFGVVGSMFLEHILRSHRLGFNHNLTISWIIYRSIVLVILIAIL